MTYVRRMVVAGSKLPHEALEVARNTEHLLAALVLEVTALYRAGGFLGILIGVSTSILASHSRRLGR
jgi:hypothetical protein